MSLVAVERAVTTFSAQVVEVEGLLAPLEVPILEQQVRIEGIHVDRIAEAWTVLAHRITQR